MIITRQTEMIRRAPKRGRSPFELATFLPYKLAVLSGRIGRRFAEVHASRFGLSGSEWRTLAVLGQNAGEGGQLSAIEVGTRAAIDPVSTHRAIERLVRANLVVRATDSSDRRRSALRITTAGCTLYERMVPLARELESEVVSALAPQERREFERLLTKLLNTWKA